MCLLEGCHKDPTILLQTIQKGLTSTLHNTCLISRHSVATKCKDLISFKHTETPISTSLLFYAH